MDYEISLLTTMGVSVLFALSLNLITGFCGQISLGHAAFLGIGAYAAALLGKAGLPFLATIPLAMLLAGAIGAVVGLASLRVRAANNDGVWNQAGIRLALVVTPPFWATLWFRALLLLGLVAGLAYGHHHRTARLRAHARELSQRVLERTSDLAFEVAERTPSLACW